MQQYNIFQAIFMSFYSRRLYRDIAMNWGAKSFGYLFLLLALSWVVFTAQLQMAINHGYSKISTGIVTQIPTMTIKDGKLSTPEDRPYLVVEPKSKQILMVIDTSGQYKTLEEAGADVLVTDTKIISKPKPNQERIDAIPEKMNMVIKPDVINGFIEKFIGFSWIVIFIIALLGSYIYRIIQSLLYAIIGKVLSLIFRVSISYWQVLQIMMVAITPVIVVNTVCRALLINVPHHNLFYFGLAMLYLIFGILSNKGSANFTKE